MGEVVYFGFDSSGLQAPVSNLLNFELDPLGVELNKLHGGKEYSDFLRCYAFQDHIKNTFIFRAPVTLDVEYVPDDRGFIVTNLHLDQRSFDTVVSTSSSIGYSRKTFKVLQFFPGCGLCLLAKGSSLPFSIHPANFHSTGISTLPMITGTFDCGKWFRPLNMAVINKDKKNISIKRGDPLFYVKFHTDTPVDLRRVRVTESMVQIARANGQFSNFVKGTPLNKLYEYFATARHKKVLMDEIRKQEE